MWLFCWTDKQVKERCLQVAWNNLVSSQKSEELWVRKVLWGFTVFTLYCQLSKTPVMSFELSCKTICFFYVLRYVQSSTSFSFLFCSNISRFDKETRVCVVSCCAKRDLVKRVLGSLSRLQLVIVVVWVNTWMTKSPSCGFFLRDFKN